MICEQPYGVSGSPKLPSSVWRGPHLFPCLLALWTDFLLPSYSMDVVFGAVSKEERMADFDAKQRATASGAEGGSISGGSYDGIDDEKYAAEHVERKV